MGEEIIELSTDEEHICTEEKPGHHDHDASQASVHVGEAVGIVIYESEEVGDNNPADRYNHSTGQHTNGTSTGIGKDRIDEDQLGQRQCYDFA